MDLEVRTTTTSGTRTNVFKNTHGFETRETVTIDIAALDGDWDDETYVGYIPQGFPLGKITSGGKYAMYDDAHSDGTQTLVGFLAEDVPVAADTTTVSVPMQRHAHIIEANLPVAIDANGKTDVGQNVIFF